MTGDAVARRRSVDIRNAFLYSYGFSVIFSAITPRLDLGQKVLATLLFGTVFGIMMGTLIRFGIWNWRRPSFLGTVALRTAVISLGVVVAFTFSLHGMIAISVREPFWSERVVAIVGAQIVSPWFAPVVGGVAVGIFLVSGMRVLNRKLGPGVLANLLLGRYHDPRRETRTFLFLDMKGSTTHAERLGELEFSALVRDFMNDLTDPLLATRAEVSHYIGDEAVITWPPRTERTGERAVELVGRFRDRLVARRVHYETRYGVVPGFKAGGHAGAVVATEVGDLKSEIVFHGDVLNVAARVQGLSAETGFDLLLTDAVDAPSGGVALGERTVKGRTAPVSLVGYFPAD